MGVVELLNELTVNDVIALVIMVAPVLLMARMWKKRGSHHSSRRVLSEPLHTLHLEIAELRNTLTEHHWSVQLSLENLQERVRALEQQLSGNASSHS